MSALRKALNDEIVRILASMDGSATGRLTASADSLRNAQRVRLQLLAALRDAGVDVVEEETERAAAEIAAEVLRTVPGAEEFAPDAIQNIERVMQGQLSSLADVWSDGADALRLAIDRGIVTGADLSEVTENVQAALDVTFSQAETVVNSAIMGTHRQTLLEVGEEADDEIVYLYLGADDSKTRPFCAEHKDKAYSKEALDRLDNGPGQPKPVSAFLGGYNCRHTLSPMTIEDANEDGIEVIL
jgi:hypothetical protein